MHKYNFRLQDMHSLDIIRQRWTGCNIKRWFS